MPGYLRLIKKDGTDGPFMEIDKPEITLGRSDECDIRILLSKVSRLHATVTAQGETILLNNTSKNSIRIKNKDNQSQLTKGKNHPLRDGDEFFIYERAFRFEGIIITNISLTYP